MNSRPISRPPADLLSAAPQDASAPRPVVQSTDEKKQRGTNRSVGAFEQIRNFIDRVGYNDSEAAKALGYAPGAVHYWRSEGKAPVVAGLAAECLVRRLGPNNAAERTFAFKISGADADAVLHLLAKLGVKVKEL